MKWKVMLGCSMVLLFGCSDMVCLFQFGGQDMLMLQLVWLFLMMLYFFRIVQNVLVNCLQVLLVWVVLSLVFIFFSMVFLFLVKILGGLFRNIVCDSGVWQWLQQFVILKNVFLFVCIGWLFQVRCVVVVLCFEGSSGMMVG